MITEETRAEADKCIDHIDDYFVSSGVTTRGAIASLVYILLKTFSDMRFSREKVETILAKLLVTYDAFLIEQKEDE
jgi:hypothetical protein